MSENVETKAEHESQQRAEPEEVGDIGVWTPELARELRHDGRARP